MLRNEMQVCCSFRTLHIVRTHVNGPPLFFDILCMGMSALVYLVLRCFPSEPPSPQWFSVTWDMLYGVGHKKELSRWSTALESKRAFTFIVARKSGPFKVPQRKIGQSLHRDGSNKFGRLEELNCVFGERQEISSLNHWALPSSSNNISMTKAQRPFESCSMLWRSNLSSFCLVILLQHADISATQWKSLHLQ
jgi:hypothetical protein